MCCRTFFCTYNVRVFTSMLPPDIYYDNRVPQAPQTPQAQHSTAQRSQPAQQAAKQVQADQSATTQASRRSWLAPAYRRAYTQLAVFSKRTKKSKSARPAKILLVRCAKGLPVHYSCVLSISSIPVASGLFWGPWSSWHLQVAS